MITDTIENARAYDALSPRIAAALQFLRRPDLAGLPLGRHDIDGNRLFALIQEYSTKQQSECFWEAHRRYIDIQFIQSGIEVMGWSPISKMTVQKEYDPEKDFVVLSGEGQPIEVPAGHFAVFMPHDAHMPCLSHRGTPSPVRKIVVKVAMDEWNVTFDSGG